MSDGDDGIGNAFTRDVAENLAQNDRQQQGWKVPSPAELERRQRAAQTAIDCLAEIIYGAGLRVPVWGRAKVALETLGITTAPPKRTDAER